ncbi:transcriptional repressor LexA [Streptomyces sp. NPDC057302]|uniref:transcriptional repressor LexA n=1 Tax=Streptomyces sp. NPDC057302 TaxID=3346094 RepID=UPI003638AC20
MSEGSELNPPPTGRTKGLTVRQDQVLRAIRDGIRARGYPPSLQEIGAAAGLTSTSSVSHHLDVLCQKGWLRHVPNQARSYVPAELVHEPDVAAHETSVVRVPLIDVATVGGSAGREPVLEMLDLPRQLVGDGELFSAVVIGRGMESAGVLDQDIAVVRRSGPVESGVLVALLLDGEATVRRLKRDGANTWLLTGNGAGRPVWCHEAALLGRVVAVLRCL